MMMPSHTADETAKRPPTSRPARKGQQWRWDDYLAVAVGLLFVTAMLLSFRINDWVMQTFAWDRAAAKISARWEGARCRRMRC